ncbi:MAG: DUF3352 domain-containing protein [Anaerolineae bacterium]|nr:DUF3352 domain-containing protein [Anaerolineae bacterium]
MRKTLLAFLFITLLILSSIPALALPPDDLNTLGSYLPADTPLLISFRTDDAFIETLDGLIERLNAVTPADEEKIPTLSKMLNSALRDMDADFTFDETVRSWLGDTGAFAMLSFDMLVDDSSSNDDEAPMVFAAQITDREAAVAFFEDLLESGGDEYVRVDEDSYTILRQPDDAMGSTPTGLVVTEDAILLSNQLDAILVGDADEQSLADNSLFTDALDRLPADDYNMTIYYDTPALFEAMISSDPEVAQAMEAYGALLNSLEGTATGLTIFDNTALVIDVAQQAGDMPGMSLAITAPVDLSFGRYIIGDTPFYVQGTDLNASVTMGLDSLDVALQAQAEMMAEAGVTPDEVTEGLAQVEEGFTALTGLDLYDDVLSWMTGNYALSLGFGDELMNALSGMSDGMPVHLAFLVEVTDAEAAQNTVTGLSRALNQLAALIEMSSQNSASTAASSPTAEISEEEIGGTTVTVLTITTPDMPFPVEILLGANESVFALGTRDAVTTALTGDGGLSANARYTNAQSYLLPDASSIGWFNPEGLTSVMDLMSAFASETETADAQAILGAVESATVSSSLSEDGVSIARMVLTLTEE